MWFIDYGILGRNNVNSYAIHTVFVWALASTLTFSHVHSGERYISLYLTDLTTRQSILLFTKEHPIQQVAMLNAGIWVAATDSRIHKSCFNEVVQVGLSRYMYL